jgi:hypothetical protein
VIALHGDGLHAGGPVAREISARGLAAIPPWMRARLPAEIDLAVPAHRRAIREVFHDLFGPDATEERFRGFYEVQTTWDETMAESAARALAGAPPDAAIVVLAGSMHVKIPHAIPERARRRNGLDYRVVLPVDAGSRDAEGLKAGMGRPADYAILTNPAPERASVRLGVSLRGGDTLVTLVGPGSAAEQAGLLAGDRLLSVDGAPIADAVDIRLALETRRPGDRVRLRWRREGEEEERTGEGTLAAPASPFDAPSPRPPSHPAVPPAAPK